jgi:glycosyltransferase involved in cell wall biosynthesis
VIIVDDGSVDDTSVVGSSFEDTRVKYIRHDRNMGISAASNTGFRYSKGDYIALLGDDDGWCDEEKLKKQLHVYRQNRKGHIGIVCTWWREIRENQVIEHTPNPPNCWKERILVRNGIICGSTPLIPRNVWMDVRGFDEQLRRGTDSDLFRRIIVQGYTVVIIPEIMVNVYVNRGDRITIRNRVLDIDHGISNKKRRLEMFYEDFQSRPKSLSKLYSRICYDYLCRYDLARNKTDLVRALKYLFLSMSSSPFNYSAIRYCATLVDRKVKRALRID